MAPNNKVIISENEILDFNNIPSIIEYTETKYPPLEDFEHTDPGHLADPKKASLYDNAESIKDLTPNVGTEIQGIQLSQLTDQQKNDLALLCAERGVVFFRNQDINPHQLVDLGRHYGPLHIHNSAPHLRDLPETIAIYFNKENFQARSNIKGKMASDGIHTDISYEHQPAALSFLKLEVLPPCGGDTLWWSAYQAYDRLSKPMQKFVETLTAVHTGEFHAKLAKATGRPIRREFPPDTVHPVVRTHPVTGWKGLFVQPGFTKSLVGFTPKESETILKLLYDHVAGGYDFQVRFKWEEGSVAVWDNRCTFHCAIFDYFEQGTRFGVRVTPTGEKPYFDPNSKSRKEDLEERKKNAIADKQ
ncbi:unnamed protein product [Cunninghamella blakesleeana]